MKLGRYNTDSTGLLTTDGDTVIDVAASLDALAQATPDVASVLRPVFSSAPADWVPLIADWDRARVALRELQRLGDEEPASVTTQPVASVALAAPLPNPHVRVFAAGGNFEDHIRASAKAVQVGRDVENALANPLPWGFFVIPGTIVGPGATVTPPDWSTNLDYEAEVAVVLRNGGGSMPSGGLEVWGYTGWNDFSLREQPLGGRKVDPGPLAWTFQKNFDTGHACGPWMVIDEPLVAGNVHFSMKVNGEQRQSSSTSAMLFSYDAIAAWVSQYVSLAPGDMILSGTPMGTAIEGGLEGPYLRNGDVTEVEVEGSGVLRNTIKSAFNGPA